MRLWVAESGEDRYIETVVAERVLDRYIETWLLRVEDRYIEAVGG